MAGARDRAAALPADHVFCEPKRRIAVPMHVDVFSKSAAFSSILGFVETINKKIRGKAISDPFPRSKAVDAVVAMLDTMDKWIDEIPAIDSDKQRFGNPAFRDWMARLDKEAPGLVEALLPAERKAAVVELVPYLTGGFGNATRIDYGSGHELSFAAFLLCLAAVGVLEEGDLIAVAFAIFPKYLKVVRRLQMTYRLEPAGSHGVWGLDDFQFLPYLWGSSQQIGGRVQPSSIPERSVADANSADYLFFGAISFIFEMKTGPFFEHSRYLYDMSAVQEWKKVNTGLIKMYKGEVLLKFPVIQHFLFGSILPLDLPEAPASTPTQNVGVGDMHPSMTGRMPPAGRMPPPGKVPPTAFPHARPK